MIFFNFDGFWSLCLLKAILAQKENSYICKKSDFLTPLGPLWGRVNSGKNFFWVQTATVSWLCFTVLQKCSHAKQGHLGNDTWMNKSQAHILCLCTLQICKIHAEYY